MVFQIEQDDSSSMYYAILISIMCLILSKQLNNCFSQQLKKELVTISTSHHLIQLSHKPISQTITVIQKTSSNIITFIPAISFPCFNPITSC
ncbi:hypothetical protein KIW84_UN0020 [Lathyrus oleraceus]|nr:hypothetical protein KIW84_UN0020 [Pisum sativum]